MRARGLLTAVLLIVALAAPVTPAAPATAEAPGDFRITAHRGSPDASSTENTLPALRRAIRLKASALEVDVRMTRDGQFVLMHDATLQRTTTCSGRVADRSGRYLRRQCRSERGRDWVPSLGAALRLARHHRVNVLVELKPERLTRADADRLGRLVEAKGMRARTVVMSFHGRPLRRIEATHPRVETAFLVRGWAQVAKALTYADGISVRAGLLTPGRVRDVRADGSRIIATLANGVPAWRRIERLDVGALVTDRVTGYRRWLRR